MTPDQLEWIIRIAFFALGYSVCALIYELCGSKHLKEIADSTKRFVAWAEKEDKK